MKKLKITSSKTIKLLYQLMYDVHKILTKNNIPYWVEAGTFLGTIRHKGIIPWDDDVDIAIDRRDTSALLKLKSKFKKCGLILSRHWIGYKVYYAHIPSNDPKHKYSFPNLDIFPMEFTKNNTRVQYSRKPCRELWPKAYFLTEELFPLKQYDFGDFKIYGPNKYNEYFTRAYGKNWNKIAYREYDHENEEEQEKTIIKLSKKDRQPAKPTKVVERKCST